MSLLVLLRQIISVGNRAGLIDDVFNLARWVQFVTHRVIQSLKPALQIHLTSFTPPQRPAGLFSLIQLYLCVAFYCHCNCHIISRARSLTSEKKLLEYKSLLRPSLDFQQKKHIKQISKWNNVSLWTSLLPKLRLNPHIIKKYIFSYSIIIVLLTFHYIYFHLHLNNYIFQIKRSIKCF